MKPPAPPEGQPENDAMTYSEPSVDSTRGDELPSWMKKAFVGAEDDAHVDVLRGVQERLNVRSGGKFYRDGWSTTRHAPFSTYFITALLMLATVTVIYSIVTPIIPEPLPESQPVRVIPPR